MQADSKKVTITLAQPTIVLPSGLRNGGVPGPYFIDALPVPKGAKYTSAAILGSTSSEGSTWGMLAWSPTSSWAQDAPVPLDSVTAVCGIAGGLVGLAKVDGQGKPSVELRNSALVDPPWSTVRTITFPYTTGTIQAMAQRGDRLYGFIKSSPYNAFFSVNPQDSVQPLVVYYSAPDAAAAFFPLPKDPPYIGIPQPIAFYRGSMYAVGESHANVLCASLDYSMTTSSRIPRADTWSLYIDEPLNKVYGLYDPLHGSVLPYTIQADGSFHREDGTDTLKGGACNTPALDSNLRLLYMVSEFAGLQVVDVDTEKVIPLGKNNPLPPLFVNIGGTWADSTNSLLLVSSIQNPGALSELAIYKVSVTS